MLVTKKTAATLGLSIHDGVGSKVSIFARRQMEKMGWEEGKGLGKNETGISKHIKAVKRDDSSGLGLESVEAVEVNDNWWHDAFSKQLKTFQTPKKGSKSKKEKSLRKGTTDDAEKPPSYADLFAATGGARLGMRARASQKGKILRTESSNVDVRLSTAEQSVSSDTQSLMESDAKRKKKSRGADVIDEVTEVVAVDPGMRKKKKSKGDAVIEEVADESRLDVPATGEPDAKRKKKSRGADVIDEVTEVVAVDPGMRKKKKSKGDAVIEEVADESRLDVPATGEPDAKRKKKSRA